MTKKHFYIIASEEEYHYGDIIYREGTSGDWIYVILSGSIEISRNVEGHKYIIDILKPGALFGEIESLGRIKRTSTARAIDDTTVGIIDRAFVDKEYNQLSHQFRSIIDSLVGRSRKLLDRSIGYTERMEPREQKVLAVSFQDRNSFLEAYTTNISTGGLYIKTENFLNPGQVFTLKLQLPETPQAIQIQCEVIWARKREKSLPDEPPGMGVKFTKISKTDYLSLKKFLSNDKTGDN